MKGVIVSIILYIMVFGLVYVVYDSGFLSDMYIQKMNEKHLKEQINNKTKYPETYNVQKVLPVLKYKYNADKIYFFDFKESNFIQFGDIGNVIYFELFQNECAFGRFNECKIPDLDYGYWAAARKHNKALLVFKNGCYACWESCPNKYETYLIDDIENLIELIK